MKRIPRWVFAVVAVALIAVAGDAALFLGTDRAKPIVEARPASEGVAVIDAARRRLVGHLVVGRQPTEVAASLGDVWVLNKSDGNVSRIDERSRRVVATIEPPEPADGLAFGDGGLWLTGHGRFGTFTSANPHGTTMIHRLDAHSGAVDHSIEVKTGSARIAAGAGAIWTTGFVDGDVRRGARADETTGSLSILDDRVFGDLIVAGRRSAYYVTSLGARVQRVDGRTGRLIGTLNLADVHDLVKGKVPPNPTGLALGAGSLWLSQTDGTVLRIDTALTRVTHTIKVCRNAVGVAFGDAAIWAACGDGTAVRVDPATDAVGPVVALGGGLPRGIAAGGGAVWVTLN